MSKTETEHVQYVLQDRAGTTARVLVLVPKIAPAEGEDEPPVSPLHAQRGLPLNIVQEAYVVYNVTDGVWVKDRQQERSNHVAIDEWLKARGFSGVDSLKNANYIVRPKSDQPDLVVGFFLERDADDVQYQLGFHLGWPIRHGFTEERSEHP